jgi:hypothetical protein
MPFQQQNTFRRIMSFTKHTGIDQSADKPKVIAGKDAEEAKSIVKQGSKSLIDAVDKAEEEDENV